jgi:tetratricopeptide (TPR) repeat protein
LSFSRQLGGHSAEDGSVVSSRFPVDGQSSGLLLERETELSYLSTVFERAWEGRGSVVAFDAPPGIGKSQLLVAASRMARDRGLQVMTAAGREIESEFTFGVTLQLLEARVAGASPKERGRLFAGPAQLAEPLFARGPGDRAPKETEGFSLLRGLYGLCVNLALEQPLALIVDDAHNADCPSLRFALYLAQRLDELSIGLVLAGDLRSSKPSAEYLAELLACPIARTLELDPLSPGGVATLLRRSLFPDASDSFCLACFGATGGNPVLLRELAVDLAAEGEHGDGDAAQVLEAGPDSVARSVLLRLHAIGPGATELAQAVAVLGYGAELQHAARIAKLEPSHAARVADEMMGADVLAPAELLSFLHPIVRRAVEAAMPPVEHAAAHLRAAQVLAEDGASLSRVAAHLLQSSRTGSEWVADVLADAAAASMGSGAPESATRYLSRALEEPPSPSRRPELVLQLGRAEALLAAPEALPRLREALELIHEPIERGTAALGIGRMLCAQGRYAEAAEGLRRGLAELGGADAELRAQLLAAYAPAARLGLLPERIEPEALPEARLASESPDTPAARVAYAELALTRALDGQPVDEVRELAHHALGGDSLLALETADGLGYYVATTALTICEDYQSAELALTAAIQDARERGSALGYATASGFRALTFFGRGRLADAEADAEGALAAVSPAQGVVFPAVQAVLGEVLMERGQLDKAEQRMGRPSLPEGSGLAKLIRLGAEGHLRRRRGDVTGALDAFERCGVRLAEANIRNPAVLNWRSGAALALADLGDRERAVRLLDEELELARAFGAPGAIGSALHASGLIAAGDDRARLLEAALTALERSQKALARARVLVELGATLRRAGTPRAARDPLRQGLDLAERCGATVLAQRARKEVAAAGSRPRRTALSGTEALTTRERQVAELACPTVK